MDRWWRFDRSDYVVLRAVLGLAVLYSMLRVVLGLVDWLRGRPVLWHSATQGEPPRVAEAVPGGAHGVYDSSARWTIPSPTFGQRVGSVLPDLWSLAVVLLIATALWRLVRSVERGQPFSVAGVRAVRTVGLVLLGSVVLGWFVALVADQLVMMPLRHTLLWNFEITDAGLALALTAVMVVALAEVWRQGRDTARDVEGLI